MCRNKIRPPRTSDVIGLITLIPPEIRLFNEMHIQCRRARRRGRVVETCCTACNRRAKLHCAPCRLRSSTRCFGKLRRIYYFFSFLKLTNVSNAHSNGPTGAVRRSFRVQSITCIQSDRLRRLLHWIIRGLFVVVGLVLDTLSCTASGGRVKCPKRGLPWSPL